MPRVRVVEIDPDDPVSARDAEWAEKIKKILDKPKHEPKNGKEKDETPEE